MNSIQDILDFVENWKTNNGYDAGEIVPDKEITRFVGELQDMVGNMDYSLPKDTTIIGYSGSSNGDPCWKIADNLSSKGDDYTYISDLPAGKLLGDKRKTLEASITKITGDADVTGQITSGWRGGARLGPSSGFGSYLSLDDFVSSKLMGESTGVSKNLIVFTPDEIESKKVFASTEIDRIFANKSFKYINGIPKSELEALYRSGDAGKETVFQIISKTSKETMGSTAGIPQQATLLEKAIETGGKLNPGSSDFSINVCFDDKGNYVGTELFSRSKNSALQSDYVGTNRLIDGAKCDFKLEYSDFLLKKNEVTNILDIATGGTEKPDIATIIEYAKNNDIQKVYDKYNILTDAEIRTKYGIVEGVGDKEIINFYRKAEYYARKGNDIANIKVGDLIKDTDVPLSLEDRIIIREAQDLSVADFLEFSGKEKGIHSSTEVGKAVQKAQTKIKVMKGLRKFETYSNVAMTAIFVVQTAFFIVDLVDDYKKGDVTSREAAKKVTEYVGGLVGGAYAISTIGPGIDIITEPLIIAHPLVGGITNIALKVIAGALGAVAGEAFVIELFDKVYDTPEGIFKVISGTTNEIEGSDNNDLLDFSSGVIVNGFIKTDVDGMLYIKGRGGDDWIVGYDYSDEINGGAGNDHIEGGNGGDLIYGEDGEDYILGQEGWDRINGGPGNDTIYGDNGEDKLNGDDGNDIIFGGNDNDTIKGGSGNDHLYGEEGIDYIYGGADNDYIEGGGDQGDFLFGNSGDDFITAGNGNDEIEGGSGDDIIFSGAGSDVIYGDDKINVDNRLGFADQISGGNSDDIIYGCGGDDYIWGDQGEDKLFGNYGNDTIIGGSNNDMIYGGADNDTLYGNTGDDTINGGNDNDELYGGEHNDKLRGDKGNDTLDGGSGDDKLCGGDGYDTYIFGKGYNNDIIYDPYAFNTIIFTDIEYDELIPSYSETNNKYLVLDVASTSDTLTIIDFKELQDKFQFEFEKTGDYYILEENDGIFNFIKKDYELGFDSSMNNSVYDKVKSNITIDNVHNYNKATTVLPPRDPLVIDFSDNGTASEEGLVNTDDGVYFDLDNNGFAEKTAWISADKGFLAYDRNGNGIIDNGSELFGDSVIMSDGRKSEHGFEALADLDSNGDGVIDKDDAKFKDLRVWKDTEKNGRTDTGELYTIEELGIESISLTTTNKNQTTESGTIITDSAVVKYIGSKTTEIAEHWFEAHSYDTQELNIEGDGVSLTSFGSMPSLTNALATDESGKLALLVEAFKKAGDFAEKRIITKKILYFITGANVIPADSRGGIVDARDLHVIEAIMGVDSFVGADGSTTPNSNAAPVLKKLYVQFENLYLSLLDNELDETGYIEYLEEVIDENNNIVIDPEYIDLTIENASMLGKNVEKIIFSIGSYLKTYDKACGTNCFRSFKERYSEYADRLETLINADTILGTDDNDILNGTNASEIFWGDSGNDAINAGSGDDIVYGGDGNDEITGSDGNDLLYGEDGDDIISGNAGNDVIYAGIGNDAITGGTGEDVLYGEDGNDILDGGEDNDVLYGGDGNDSLSGCTGDDILSGGAGDDTYIINADHGNDTIYDSEGLSTLVFGDELSADDYSLHIDINSGIFLVNTETEETISIPDFINMPEAYDFTFEGEAQIIGGGSSRQVIEGTDEDDTITAENGFNIIRGGNGDDTITGGDNLDFIYGGNGNDVINGGNGTNIIRGEAGDDTITDGVNDGYLDGGDGNDTIHAGAGNDVIIGGAGVDILYGEDGDDVIAGNEDNDEIYGGNGNDTVYADAGNDTVHGDDGNDSLFGGDGNDTLYGDAGDDYLEAGNGEDTLYGGEGNDVFVGGEGINNMYGEDGDDIFHGGNGINNMYGGDGDDNFTGGELADYIEGGAGNDTMNGGNGNNRMFGNDGDDTIYGGNDDDHIDGGEGNDEVFGGNGVNTIYGGAGNDIIHDGDNNSFLYGGDGDDEIRAGGGSDVLDGGAGNDYLQSDHGGDIYVFGIGYDVDTINASADLNTILIHGYTAADMHNTRMQNNDLVIDFGEDTGDRLVITGFFNFTSNRDFNFTFDDETVLGQHDITAKSAPITGTDDNDYLFGTDGNDIFDGGAGDDSLNGSNGEDTYIFGKGYAHDTINEWGSDHSFVELKDVASDEVTISDQWGSNLLIAVNDTEDVLTISNFKWGQASYTFRFADGAEGYVDKETWQLVLTKQPEPVEEDIEQTNAELLNEIYSDDEFGADIFENDSTIISEVTDSITVSDDTDEISDMTDIQTMILAENMSAFSDDSNVYDNTNITDITADTSALDQLIVSSVQ